MQIAPTQVEKMNVPELDELRHQLHLSKAQVCQRGALHPSTYTRWMKYFQGEPGGSCPNPRSVRALREVLIGELARRGEALQQRPAA